MVPLNIADLDAKQFYKTVLSHQRSHHMVNHSQFWSWPQPTCCTKLPLGSPGLPVPGQKVIYFLCIL